MRQARAAGSQHAISGRTRENRCDAEISHRLSDRYFKKNRAQDRARSGCHNKAKDGAGNKKAEAMTKDQPPNISPPRAERETQPEFPEATRRVIGKDTVKSDGGQQQG